MPLGLRSIDVSSHQKRVIWCALGGRAQWNICIDLDDVRAGAIDSTQILDGERHLAGTCRELTRLVKQREMLSLIANRDLVIFRGGRLWGLDE